jgi:DNA-binding CsgD family transcriptional regulator
MSIPSSEQVIKDIYDAAGDPQRWDRVLQFIGDSVGASASLLLTARHDNWVGWRHSIQTPATVSAYLRSEASPRSQATPRLLAMNHPGFVAEHDAFSEMEFLRDPLMTEWGTPENLHHAAATAIHMPTGDMVVFHLQRRRGLPIFSKSDISALDTLRPHLARAGLLAVRWRLERLKAATEALELVGLPALVLDYRGQVIAANALISETNGCITWLPNDNIALKDPSADGLLKRAIKELPKLQTRIVKSIPVRTADLASPAVVHLIPTIGHARDVFGGAYGMLVVTSISASPPPSATLLQALFDFTPAEARVARGLSLGLTLKQIAAIHCLSIETVRTQTKAVLGKTGTTRQAQVAVLFSSLNKLPIS